MNTGSTPVTQIDKYQVLGVLGVGGMGVVDRGWSKNNRRVEAVLSRAQELSQPTAHR